MRSSPIDVAVMLGVGLLVAVGVYGLMRLAGPLLLRLIPRTAAVRFATEPMPEAWRAIVERHVPLLRRLAGPDRERVMRLAQVFIRDVPFEGCGGLDVTEEMRVTIAATACLLVVNLAYPWFSKLRRVLLYPSAFEPVHLTSRHAGGIQSEAEPAAGEAWLDGIVVLAWDSVVKDRRLRGRRAQRGAPRIRPRAGRRGRRDGRNTHR